MKKTVFYTPVLIDDSKRKSRIDEISILLKILCTEKHPSFLVLQYAVHGLHGYEK